MRWARLYLFRGLLMIALLILAACEPPPEQAGEAPTVVPEEEGEVVLDVMEEPAEVSSGLECDEPFEAFEPVKPPLSLDRLPPPPNPLLVNENRVVGFAFAEGGLTLVASPASARCDLVDPALGQALGTVYTLADPNEPVMNIVSIVPEEGIGFILDENLQIVQQGIEFTATELVSLGDGVPPIDAKIRADSVCFRLDVDERPTRFCSHVDALSVRALFPAYEQAVVQSVLDAEGVLLDQAENFQEFFPEDVADPFELLAIEQSLAAVAVSEIESPVNVLQCQQGECLADITVAPFGSPPQEAEAFINLGILVVHQDLTDPAEEMPVLEPGSYIIFTEAEAHDQRAVPLMVVGVTDGEELVEPQELMSSRAAYVDAETAGVGTVAISGCQVWWACILWEVC